MTTQEFINRVKRAPKKNIYMGLGCVVAVVALTIYWLVGLF